MRVAVSTENEKEITRDHFGEGKFFLIYEFDSEGYRLVEKRENTSPEEEEHGSEIKAKGISAILKDVPILLGYQFGPNIYRIKEKFLPVVSRERIINNALELLWRNYNTLQEYASERGIVLILDGGGLKKIKLKDGKDF